MTGGGEATWADLAEAVFAEAHARGRRLTRVKRIATADYPTPARRPANSRLDNGKLARAYGLALPDVARVGRCLLRPAAGLTLETERMRKVLVTGGAGFIGSAVCRHLVGAGVDVLNVDNADLRGQSRLARDHRQRAELSLRQDRHLRPGGGSRRRLPRLPAGPRHPSRRREPRRPLDHRQRRLHPDQHPRHVLDAGGGARLLARARRRDARRVPLPARLDRRGLRLARARRPVRRDDALRSELALFRLQGGLRPPRLGLGAHLQVPGRDLQLLEQLRPLPFPREADPARHPQRRARQAAAGLRRGRPTCATGSMSRTTPARSTSS